jgi:homoserine O-acetyltransferase
MTFLQRYRKALLTMACVLFTFPGLAADHPVPKEGSWVVRDFKFHTGEVLPELRLNYTTLGAPAGEPVLVLHGTAGSGTGMLAAGFGGELFGPGKPLDASRYFIILPDAIGTGKSSKPSDGLRARFPKYNYADMVAAQHRLVTEHLGVQHLRLVIGNSMGGMQTWLWAQNYPALMDIAVPMASMPTIKTNCPTETGWASADFATLSLMSNRATPTPTRCRRVERLRRIGRALRETVEPSGPNQ